MPTPPQKLLVTDFDGTLTEHDFFELVRRNLPSVSEHDHWQDYVEGRKTHFEALAAIFSAIRTDWRGMEAVLEAMRLDPRLPEAVERLQAEGWRIVVASAGCGWYIERLLERANVRLEVHANPGSFAPETGLVLEAPIGSPFFRAETGIDKSAIVRAALERDPNAAFAGDGRPDLAPALLVKPERRFARGWLAEHFEKTNEPFHRFDQWSRIADLLLAPR